MTMREGWTCPKCGCGVSPDVERCPCASAVGPGLPGTPNFYQPGQTPTYWPYYVPATGPHFRLGDVVCGGAMPASGALS